MGAPSPHPADHPPLPRRQRHPAPAGRRPFGGARRAAVPGRAQRLRQVDAAEDRRRAAGAGQRRALPAAGHGGALPAAGAGFCRLRNHPRLCRGRAGAARRSLSRAEPAGRARHDGGRGPGDAVGRRGAARGHRARAGARARHPAARRADQPPRPAGDRMAGGRAEGSALGARADLPRPALPHQPVAALRVDRPRRHPLARQGVRRVRGLARPPAGGGGGAAA